MPEQFGGDLRGAEFWGAEMTGARFRDVNLTDAKISHAWLVNVDVDALVDNLVINGVDVTDYVNERDPWFPLRAMLTPTDPPDMQHTWTVLDGEWATTLQAADGLPEAALHESVDGEWSLVQTLRHLVFAMDKWFTAPILGEGFHAIGLTNTGSTDLDWPGIDADAAPTVADALAVRHQRSSRFREYLASISAADLDRTVDVLENGPHHVRDCLHTVFEEEFWHLRYARRDLETLGATVPSG